MDPVESSQTTPPVEKHRPWKTLEDTVRAIIDHTFDAALDMRTHSHRSSPVADLRQPIDPAGRDSPELTVHAEATTCCFAFNNSRRDAAAFAKYTSKSGKSTPTHLFRGATISISPWTLQLAHDGRRGVVGGSADVNPVVGSSSVRPLVDVMAILDAVVQRLDAAIGVEEAMLGEANALPASAWCGGSRPRVAAQIEQALDVLREMRSEMDIEAFMRRRLQKRRRCVVEEIGTSRPADAVDRDRVDKTAEELAKRFKRMKVGSSSR